MKATIFRLLSESLRTRIFLIVMCSIVGGMLIAMMLASQRVASSIERLISDQQQAATQFMADKVNQELHLRLDALEKYAVISTEAMAKGQEAISEFLQGRAFLNTLFNGGVIALGTDGTALADTLPLGPRVGTNYGEVDSVIRALREGRSSIGQPIIGKKLRAPIINMAVPLRDRTGRIVGALVGITNLADQNFLDSITDKNYDNQGGYILLVAPRERLIVTATDKRRIMEMLPAPGVNPGIDRYLDGAEGTSILTSPAGEPVLAAVKRIPIADWYLAVLLPTKAVLAPVGTLYWAMCAAGIGITLLACGLVWLLLKSQFVPLRDAARTLRAWAATGQRPMPLPVAKQDEVGELVDGFNQLLRSIERHETALEASERRYRDVVDLVKEIIFQADVAGRWTFLNPAWTEITGFTVSETLHTYFLDYVHPDDRQHNMALFAPLIAGDKEICRHEVRYLHKNGGFRCLEVYARLTRDDAGMVIGVTGTLSDITERKRAEEQVSMLSLVVEQSPESIMITDAAARIEYANAAFYRVTGYAPEDIIGKTSEVLHSGKTPQATYDSLWQALAQNRPWKGEFHNKRKDGTEYIESAHIAPIFDAAGQHIHYVAVKEDITEMKRLQEELERHRAQLELLVDARTIELATAEHRLRTLIESSADGILELDMNGCITLVNQAATEMFGYAPEEFIGRNAHAFLHYQHPNRTPYHASECPVMDAIAKGQIMRQHLQTYWRADGNPLPVSVASHPIYNGERVTGAVMSFVDASEHARIEAEHEKARVAAERLAQVKSGFLANMSHEIRTPLNGILGLAQIGYRDNAGRDKARQTFGRILDSGKLLLTVINDILDFSKIEAGKLAIESIPIDPCRLADDAIEMVADAAAAKNLALATDKMAGLTGACLGDPMRVNQILLNLLSNAIKFTPQGGVRLGVWRDGAELVFDVTDTGIGIAAADIDRLFEPFEQADGCTTRRFGGTGLGLTISSRLATMMGGRIEVASQLGQGSTFTLRLPLRDTQPLPVTSEHYLESGSQRLSGLRILVAEDNEINRFVLEDMLQGEGAVTTMVENGRLAVEAVTRDVGAFDLFLTDVQMPEMDGLEATRHLRAIAPRLPVIGQTGHALKEEHERFHAAGMAATITKPIDLDRLVATVLQQMDRHVKLFAQATR